MGASTQARMRLGPTSHSRSTPSPSSHTGPELLGFGAVVPSGVTLHGRGEETFAMPAEGFGLAASLRALEQGTWRWRIEEDRLFLNGTMFGGPVEIRLAPVDATTDA